LVHEAEHRFLIARLQYIAEPLHRILLTWPSVTTATTDLFAPEGCPIASMIKGKISPMWGRRLAPATRASSPVVASTLAMTPVSPPHWTGPFCMWVTWGEGWMMRGRDALRSLLTRAFRMGPT